MTIHGGRRNLAMPDFAGPDGYALALSRGDGGGTRNCVDAAVERGMTVLNVWQRWSAGDYAHPGVTV